MSNEILNLIDEITSTGVIELDSRIVCKMSPHSHPYILKTIKKDDDFSSYPTPVIKTIIQRLKLILHENSKNK